MAPTFILLPSIFSIESDWKSWEGEKGGGSSCSSGILWKETKQGRRGMVVHTRSSQHHIRLSRVSEEVHQTSRTFALSHIFRPSR